MCAAARAATSQYRGPALSTRIKPVSRVLSIQVARSLHFLVLVWFGVFIVMHVKGHLPVLLAQRRLPHHRRLQAAVRGGIRRLAAEDRRPGPGAWTAASRCTSLAAAAARTVWQRQCVEEHRWVRRDRRKLAARCCLSMARGASGVWLRAVCRLACCAAARSTCWSATWRCASRWRRTGGPRAREQRRGGAGGRRLGPCPAGLARRRAGRVRAHPAYRGRDRPARATGAAGRWRQRAVSCWGCLLYAAFCLSTARLVVQAQPAQTAQSEQRQDTGVTAELLRTGWGRALLILAGVLAVAAGVETGRRSVRLDFRERFAAAHMPRALAIVTRALGAAGCVARAVVFVLVGVFLVKAGVLSSAKQAKGLERGLPLGGRLRLRALAAGRARVRPCVLRLVLPARSPLPRPDTRPLRRRWIAIAIG